MAMPAAKKRKAAIANGGKPVKPMRMPRYVEPQIRYTESSASGTTQRRCGATLAEAGRATSFMMSRPAQAACAAGNERRLRRGRRRAILLVGVALRRGR